jgi:hypothetical protein
LIGQKNQGWNIIGQSNENIIMNEILDFAVKLHSINRNWVTFFREVLGLQGIIAYHYSDPISRQQFEETGDYQEILKIFDDCFDSGIKDRNEQLKEVSIRIPLSLYTYLQEKRKEEGIKTLSQYITHKLLLGCLHQKSEGVSNETITAK